MKSARLLRLIGEVDSKFVEADLIEEREPQKHTWIKWMSLAACLVVAVSCGIGLFYRAGDTHVIVYPDENRAHNDFEDKPYLYFSSHYSIPEKPYTYKSLANQSDIIIVGDVIGTEECNDNHRFCDISVIDVLKGDISKENAVCVDEVALDTNSNNTSEMLRMHEGNRVLLFLVGTSEIHKNVQGEDAVVYSFTQRTPSLGKFFYDRDGKYHEANTYRDGFPFPVSYKLFVDYKPKTLEEIKILING